MANVKPFRPRADIDAKKHLAEFIRYSRDELTWLADRDEFDWSAPVWPFARWVKVDVGRRLHFNDDERLDAEFVEFAKSYFRWKHANQKRVSSNACG